jgi:excisionase family DNA binding protein
MDTKINSQTPQTPAYLTMSEYSDKSGISLSKVKRLKMAHRLPFIQEGKVVRIPAQALDYEWLTNWRKTKGIAS